MTAAAPATLTAVDRAIAALAQAVGLGEELVRRVVRMYPQFLKREEQRDVQQARRAIVEAARADDQRRKREGKGIFEPTAERGARGDLAKGDTMAAGVRVHVARDPIAYLSSKRLITKRQFAAAGRLRDEYELGILGTRDGDTREIFMPRGSGRSRDTFSEAQLAAAESYANAIQAVGISLSQILISVCCMAETVDSIARQQKERPSGHDKVGLMHRLRAALDRLADHYGLPADDLHEETIVLDGEVQVSVVIRYRHEADGTVSGVAYGGKDWVASAPTVGDLKALARAKLEARAKGSTA